MRNRRKAISLRKAGAHFGRYFLPLSRVLSLKSQSVNVVSLPLSLPGSSSCKRKLHILEHEAAFTCI